MAATPQVTTVTPNNGTACGGTRAVITGSGFMPESMVVFAGNAALEQTAVERTHGVYGPVDPGSSLPALGKSVIKPLPNVLEPEQVEGAPDMSGQRIDETDISVNHALGLRLSKTYSTQ